MSVRPALLLALLASPACVSGSWERRLFEREPDAALVASLRPGESDLGEALTKLGAPLYVWETFDGFALAYGGRAQREWGISVSLPLADRTSARFDYDDLAARIEGCVLIFDASKRLRLAQRGLLKDLRGQLERRRPSLVEEEHARAP